MEGEGGEEGEVRPHLYLEGGGTTEEGGREGGREFAFEGDVGVASTADVGIGPAGGREEDV